MEAEPDSEFLEAQNIFNGLFDNKKPENEDLVKLKQWIRGFKPPKESICDSDLDKLPTFHSKTVVREASANFVQLERDGFLLRKVADFKSSDHSYLHDMIFNGDCPNKFQWPAGSGYSLPKGQKYNAAKEYKMTSTGYGVVKCTPSELESSDTFTNLATHAETREDLPNFNAEMNRVDALMEFENVFLDNPEINNVPYLILDVPTLADRKIRNVPRQSSFVFKDIKNILKSLDYGQAAGFAYPYSYCYFHLSVAGIHDEEYSMNSLNINLGPGDKVWKVFPRTHAHKVRELCFNLKQLTLFAEDKEFVEICGLQHKDGNDPQTRVHTGLLALAEIPFKIVVQKPGMVIVTSSGAMHSVLNMSHGVSIAQNLLIPINFLMNPIEDLCTHRSENYEELVKIKVKALLDVAYNPPTDSDPSFADFTDVPIQSKCSTGDYIWILIRTFQHLKVEGYDENTCEATHGCEFCASTKQARVVYKRTKVTEIGLKYAFYAIKRLIKLAGLNIEFGFYTNVDGNASKSNVPEANESIDCPTSDIVDEELPEPSQVPCSLNTNFTCPDNIKKYVTKPVLCSEYNTDDLLYKMGSVYATQDTTVVIRKYDGTFMNIEISDPEQICVAVKNEEPAGEELTVGMTVLYNFGVYFKVGILEHITVDSVTQDTVYQIGVAETLSKVVCSKNLLRLVKPWWYDDLCLLNADVPLNLPKITNSVSKRKRPAGALGKSSSNVIKKIKYSKGETVKFEEDDEGNFLCPVCKDKFTRKRSLSEHFYKRHAEGYPGYTCQGCGYFSKNLKNYKKHNNDKHNGREQDLKSLVESVDGNVIKITF